MTPSIALVWGDAFPLGQGPGALALAKVGRQTFIDRCRARAFPPPFDELRPEAAADLADRWSEPCEAAFEFLAENYPPELLRLIASNRLRATDLTFAAEIAGRLSDSAAVRRTLLPLLSHDDAVVREGAIYGLAPHAEETVRSALARLSASDPSAAIRLAATETLANL